MTNRTGAVDSLYLCTQAIAGTGPRLEDREERVRLAAVRALRDIALSDALELVSGEVLEALMNRLIDKGMPVRKEAVETLVAVFRRVATIVATGECRGTYTLIACVIMLRSNAPHGPIWART